MPRSEHVGTETLHKGTILIYETFCWDEGTDTKIMVMLDKNNLKK